MLRVEVKGYWQKFALTDVLPEVSEHVLNSLSHPDPVDLLPQQPNDLLILVELMLKVLDGSERMRPSPLVRRIPLGLNI